jgi:hypothetical protein
MNDRTMDPVLSMFMEPQKEFEPGYPALLARHLHERESINEVIAWLRANNALGDLAITLWNAAMAGDTAKARSEIRAYVDAYLDELDEA